MADKKVKVYVGCSLTHAPLEFREEVAALKTKLKSICEVLEFLGLNGGTAREVYEHDINNCVRKCDIFVAICDYPSTGLGWEMAVQSEDRRMPTIAVAHENSKVTLLVLDPGLPNYEFHRYKDLCVDVFDIVKRKIEAK